MSAGGGGGKKRQIEEEHEEHENHERWLVSYADMMTLMMVLFIVMFAISAVDQEKFAALKGSLADGFGNSESVLTGTDAVLEAGGDAPILPATVAASGGDTQLQEELDDAVTDAERLRQGRVRGDAEAEAERLLGTQDRIDEAIGELGLGADVRTLIDDRGLVISLVSRHIVFEADSADLTPLGIEIVDALAPVLSELPDDLEIAGHTNQVPVRPRFYASDWDLSSARAITVLRRLQDVYGLAAGRLHAAAYGDTMPLIDPDQPRAPALNKRVDIVVMSALSGEAAELLDEAARAAGDDSDDSDGAPGQSTDDPDPDPDPDGTLAAGPTDQEATP